MKKITILFTLFLLSAFCLQAQQQSTLLNPNGKGTATVFSRVSMFIPACDSNYLWVSDVTATRDTGFLLAMNKSQEELYTVEIDSIPTTAKIDSVKVVVRARQGTQFKSCYVFMIAVTTTGSKGYYSTNFNGLKTFEDYSYTWEKSPVSNLAWTYNNITNLRIGMATGNYVLGCGGPAQLGDHFQFSQVYTQVNFTVPTGINEFQDNINIRLYNHQLDIETNFACPENIIMKMYNVIGEKVFEQNLNSATSGCHKINLPEELKGIHIIRVLSAEGIVVRKVYL